MSESYLSVGDAVKRAKQEANALFADEAFKNLALEEVEFDTEGHAWLVTLGYDSAHILKRRTGPSPFPTIEEENKREYKIFRMDAANGQLISMKIRKI